jgi:hypothetical protein
MTNKYRGKAGAYGLLAKDAHTGGERELMLRLQRSCLSLAKHEETTPPQPEGNGAENDR